MFERINSELRECKENILLKETLEKKLPSLKETYDVKLRILGELKSKLDKEFKDVKRLESLSIVSILSTILHNKEEKLYKEEQEYLEAKMKYDEYVIIVEELKNDIEHLEKRIEDIEKYEERYEELIREKSDILKEVSIVKKNEIERLEKQISDLTRENIEVEEALEEGYRCEFAINSALKSLESAKSWGTWDMFGGGGISSMMKHDAIRSSKKSLEGLGYSITKLNEELSDVNMSILTGEFESIGSKYMMDVLFDNIFTDMSVQSKITSSLNKVESLKRNLSEVIGNLSYKKEKNKEHIIAIRREYESIVEN